MSDGEDAIVPMCLYSGQKSSYIGFPNKVRENGKTVLRCDNTFSPSANAEKNYIATFYVINPDVHPIPSGMDLICVQNSFSSSVSIKQIYDPFNVDEQCIRFVAWMEPTPYTTPLYFSNNKTSMYISFDKNPPSEEYKPANIPVIYVLVDPRNTNVYRVPKPLKPETIGNKTTFDITADDIPYFTFAGYHGRCIPDPNGQHLGHCLVITDKNVLTLDKVDEENGIIGYLEDRYGNYQDNHQSKFIAIVLTITFVFILIVLIVAIVQ